MTTDGDRARQPVEDGSAGHVDGRRRWLAHNRERRKVIIDAAIVVLERHRPGDEIQVQLIAEEAGLSRTVIYRHFDDRADLDRAVQRRICQVLGDELLPAVSFEGTPHDVVRRAVAAFVRWAFAHPTLLWFAERDLPGWGRTRSQRLWRRSPSRSRRS